jgi:hypothetical protein
MLIVAVIKDVSDTVIEQESDAVADLLPVNTSLAMQVNESLTLTVEEMLLLPSLATQASESLATMLAEILDDSVSVTDAVSVPLTVCCVVPVVAPFSLVTSASVLLKFVNVALSVNNRQSSSNPLAESCSVIGTNRLAGSSAVTVRLSETEIALVDVRRRLAAGIG